MLVHSNYIPKVALGFEQFLDFNEADFQLPMLNKGVSAELPRLITEISEFIIESNIKQVSVQEVPVENLCAICYCEETDPLTLDCTHKFCKACVIAVIKNNLNSSVLSNNCPDCNIDLKEEFVLGLLDEEDIIRYNRFKIIQTGVALVNKKLAVLCPKPDCPGYAHIIFNCPNGACISCKNTFCIKCEGDVHPGIECTNYIKDEEIIKLLLSEGWKKCPCCGVPVERIDGCNFIPCESTVCQSRFAFCYQCGKAICESLHWTHYLTNGPFGETCNTLDGLNDPFVPKEQWPHWTEERFRHLVPYSFGYIDDSDINGFEPVMFNEQDEAEIPIIQDQNIEPQIIRNARQVRAPRVRAHRREPDIDAFYNPGMFAEEGEVVANDLEEAEDIEIGNLFDEEIVAQFPIIIENMRELEAFDLEMFRIEGEENVNNEEEIVNALNLELQFGKEDVHNIANNLEINLNEEDLAEAKE